MTEGGAERGDAIVGVVPNFSEGRRAEVIDAIVDALLVPGVTLLNRQADADHNRLDCTVVGSPDAVRRSALGGARAAIERIDMREHRGGHPRMGAVDVIPFMPVRGVSMDECVRLARSFARELADELGVPVYCYDRAALHPDRRSLADVRRGEYEGLREAVARGERLPDFGPHELGPAGAVAVGARVPLIAFNVYLTGSEPDAKEIARAVRESSGGLPAVRAIGFAVPDRAAVQVSMNLVDHETTGLAEAFDAVRSEAAARGMEVIESEIVGLVPQPALDAAVRSTLRLERFVADEQVLERLVTDDRAPGATASTEEGESSASRTADETIASYLDAVAASSATPGGGSAAAVAGAAGSALVAMLARLTIGKDEFVAHERRMGEIAAAADAARAEFLTLADRDAEAFNAVMAAFKLPKSDDVERQARSSAIGAAYADAADVPARVASLAVDVLELASEAIASGNPNAASDGAAGAQLLAASARSGIANVEINLGSLKDPAHADRLRRTVDDLVARTAELVDRAVAAFHARVGA